MAHTRRGTWLGIGLLFLVFGIGVILVARFLLGPALPLIGPGRVAILPVKGVIQAERGWLRHLERFRESDDVRAFVIEINSPGGTVGASQSLYREIRDLRESDDRPIIAWIGEVGASGGYYVALAADSILALPGSITGSIGVIMQLPNAQELLNDVGLELQVVKSGEHKDIGSFARPLSEEDRAILQGVVDDVYGQFVDAVVDNRPLDRARVRELADGRIFTGQQAADFALVDRVGTLDDAIELAGEMAGLGNDPRTVRPEQPRIGVFDLVNGVAESRVRAWLSGLWPGFLPGSHSPRLLYLWR